MAPTLAENWPKVPFQKKTCTNFVYLTICSTFWASFTTVVPSSIGQKWSKNRKFENKAQKVSFFPPILTLTPHSAVFRVEREARERLEVELGAEVDDEAALLRVRGRVVRPLGKVPGRRRARPHLPEYGHFQLDKASDTGSGTGGNKGCENLGFYSSCPLVLLLSLFFSVSPASLAWHPWKEEEEDGEKENHRGRGNTDLLVICAAYHGI